MVFSPPPSLSRALTSKYMRHLYNEHLGPPSSGQKNTPVSIKGIDNLQMVWINLFGTGSQNLHSGSLTQTMADASV